MDTNPYSTPSVPVAPAAQHGNQVHGPYGVFRKNNALRSAIVSLLIVEAMITIFLILIYNLVDPSVLYQNAAETLLVLGWIGVGQTVIRLSLVILFCFWINRSCKNGWLLDPPKMKTTPGWAVGYYFIPVLSLWKPFASMREIRDASYGRRDQLSATLPLWWFFWLAYLVIISITTIITDSATSEETFSIAQKLGTVTGPIRVTLDYLAIALVVGITRAQNTRVAQWRP